MVDDFQSNVIDDFHGNNRFLSNFYVRPVEFEGRVWKSAEHAYQAYKFFPDERRMKEIQEASSPKEAKSLGDLPGKRADWNTVKIEVMTQIVRQKFKDPYMRLLLVKTGNRELIEGNTWNDTFWGVCNGVGENNLGKILMKIREEINSENL